MTNGDSIPHTQEKDLPGGWVVLKFGGTSIGKFPTNIAEIVRSGLVGNRIAVVCSARSNNTKAEGTTNRLLRAARETEKRGKITYLDIVTAIQEDHVGAADDNIKSGEIKAQLKQAIVEECADLIKILDSTHHLEEVSVKAEDKIISKGEKLSCRFMAALLQDREINAHYVDLSDITDNGIRGLDDQFYQGLGHNIADRINACGDGAVPVITGYFGSIPGGLLNAIGRGYTDLCAALAAVGIKAKELQVWKEVDGIFTADPRKVPIARLLPSVSPSEAAELTFYGSEVIHPFTMEQVIKARIPIRIKNVMNPRNSGTIIFPDSTEEFYSPTKPSLAPALFRTRSSSIIDRNLRPKRPTAVTAKRGIVVLNVHSNKRTRAHGFLMKIFSTLDKWRLTVDLISSSEVHVSMALHSESAMLSGGGVDELKIQDEDLKGAVQDLSEHGTIDLVPQMAIISLVGKQLKNMVGISGKFFSVLGDNNINIEMISQGASEINISCVIEEREADRALNVIHTSLFTFLE
ncbi:aspartate kinase [Patellaria atrata CBS 101060]|uniref:Aspartokinase n=1 Tax=Patellaria atrata CBS 101060 TaxID=1346257 RepID=A0A9P4SF41_9PEZI|nr:aspartate kinase [Patellaria atrata CBS 101060]